MIVINSKLAGEVVANAIASGRVTDNSTARAYLLQCTVHLDGAYRASDQPYEKLPIYTEQEFTAAETINWLIAYLEKLNCEDIEQLLKDVAKYRGKHPDYPKGNWPK